MTIYFFQPPSSQRVGGLEAAVSSLRDYLVREGETVLVDAKVDWNTVAESNAVVHFHGLWQPSHARLAKECRARGLPYIVSPHGMLEPWAWRHKFWKKWPYFHLVEKYHLRGARCLLATSAQERQQLLNFFPHHRIENISLGIAREIEPDYESARTKLGWRSDERVILFLSRIHAKKGLEILIKSLGLLEAKFIEKTRLVIVGGGDASYVRALQNRVEKDKTRLPRIDWMGEVWGDERWKFFQGADLFCLPTHSENFGLVILEACQAGTRVLTTIATPWTVFLNAHRGLITTPDVESVHAALNQFCHEPPQTPEERAAISLASNALFAWKTIGPAYQKLYHGLAAIPHER